MKATFKAATVVIACAMASSCGGLGSKEKRERTGREITTRKDLIGTWTTTCGPSTISSGAHAKLSYEIGPINAYTFTEHVFKDGACQSADLDFVVKGTYGFPGQGLTKGTNPIDFSVKKVTLAPQTGEAAKRLNDSKACGQADWRAGTSKSVAGIVCDAWLKLPLAADQHLYQLFELREGTLFFGTPELSNAPRDASKRPSSLVLDRPFKRQ